MARNQPQRLGAVLRGNEPGQNDNGREEHVRQRLHTPGLRRSLSDPAMARKLTNELLSRPQAAVYSEQSESEDVVVMALGGSDDSPTPHVPQYWQGSPEPKAGSAESSGSASSNNSPISQGQSSSQQSSQPHVHHYHPHTGGPAGPHVHHRQHPQHPHHHANPSPHAGPSSSGSSGNRGYKPPQPQGNGRHAHFPPNQSGTGNGPHRAMVRQQSAPLLLRHALPPNHNNNNEPHSADNSSTGSGSNNNLQHGRHNHSTPNIAISNSSSNNNINVNTQKERKNPPNAGKATSDMHVHMAQYIQDPTFADISLTRSETDYVMSPKNRSGPFAGRKVRHLVIVIPGIGPHDKIATSMNALKGEYSKIVAEKLPMLHNRMEVEFIHFNWQGALHAQATATTDETVTALSLPNLSPVRNFFKDAGIDILYYFTSNHWRTIVSKTVGGLNGVYHSFCSKYKHTGDAITVSLYGHSLGGVIAYDVLDNQRDTEETFIKGLPRLEFSPQACFTMGSATGLFLAVRGKSLGAMAETGPFTHGSCKFFFNVYHPADPLAYRFEPLTNGALQHVKAVVVPHWRTGGARRADDPLAFIMDRTPKTKDKSPGENPLSGRYDFELQPKATQVSDYVTMTTAHTAYWSSSDCMFFMLTQLIRMHFTDCSHAGNSRLGRSRPTPTSNQDVTAALNEPTKLALPPKV